MEFVVESGIPKQVSGRGRRVSPSKFPLSEMDVGDSFLVAVDITDKKAVSSWRRKILAAKKRMDGGKWETATVSDGIRVWRTA